MKTDEPDSVAAPCSFGVWISTKPCESRNSRKSWPTAEVMRKMAWFVRVCLVRQTHRRAAHPEVEGSRVEPSVQRNAVVLHVGLRCQGEPDRDAHLLVLSLGSSRIGQLERLLQRDLGDDVQLCVWSVSFDGAPADARTAAQRVDIHDERTLNTLSSASCTVVLLTGSFGACTTASTSTIVSLGSETAHLTICFETESASTESRAWIVSSRCRSSRKHILAPSQRKRIAGSIAIDS